MSEKLAIVIVTYQRQELLQRLFDSLSELTMQPTALVIVDNEASADTRQLTEAFQTRLAQHAADSQTTTPEVHYIAMPENVGGAGGFSKGIETAYKLGADWFWVMDDDVKVFPDATQQLQPWLEQAVKNQTRAIQIRRKNFDGTDFYWQYDFRNHLGIPNPVAPSGFKPNELSRDINTMCFEGGLFHRSLVAEIGLPDPRYFIYWDDTTYGYLASKHTQPILVNLTLMQRTRSLDNIKLGHVRKLNATSDLSRYHIMRNRGYMAQYFRLYGDYHPAIFAFGTFLTLAKESIRLALSDHFIKGFKLLIKGMKDGKALRKDKTWQPMPPLKK